MFLVTSLSVQTLLVIFILGITVLVPLRLLAFRGKVKGIWKELPSSTHYPSCPSYQQSTFIKL